MKRQFKVALWVLALCAVCLLAGKLLRIFSEGGKQTRQDNVQDEKETEEESTQNMPGEEKEDSVLSAEQKNALDGFDGKGKVIVLDAGHGGFDPGKVGVNGAKEKEINLQIAKFLEEYLKEAGFAVVMTRTTDDGLYEETDAKKKAADMKARVQIMEESQPELAVSIHQNSFTKEASFGAQVFYYDGSAKGKALAEVLQKTFREEIADGNCREAKANATYYLLKKSPCPLVIVECGFLSNNKEAELLTTSEYQKEVAWVICLGIVKYCREMEDA